MTTRLSRGKIVPEISRPFITGVCWRKTRDTKTGTMFCNRIPVQEYKLTRKVLNGSSVNRPYVRVWLCETCAAAIARSGYDVTKVTLLEGMA
jgi:hypothetical protein